VISPTPRAIFLMLMGVPIFITLALFAPQLWILSAGWVAGVFSIILLDAIIGPRLASFRVDIGAPPFLYVGEEAHILLTLAFEAGPLPRRVEIQLETSEIMPPLAAQGLRGWEGRARTFYQPVMAERRGTATLIRLWSRWQGPLGLLQIRHMHAAGNTIPVIPNIRRVREEAIRLYARDAEFGIKAQIERGDGSEFDALREFSSGMDRRSIDWKHSARHRHLLAKEFKTERNHNIVFAFDTGRLMSEPLGGVPKIDRAVTAGLLLAYVSLRSGDRTMFYGFDARPGVTSGFLTGTSSFPKAQAIVSEMDYSDEEANFTLALTHLAGRLERRSLIVIFSDFVDTISAELMLENVRRLTDRHLVIFATFEDEALASMTDTSPAAPEDVARAVIAGTLLSERDLVFRRLQRLGVQILEARPEQFGAELVSRYLQIKRRDML
jgi:uncharacterized protein (DUF58 family)